MSDLPDNMTDEQIADRLRAKRKFYNCSPFLGQNGRKTATTTTPPAKLAPTHAPARPPRAMVAAWGRCAPILAPHFYPNVTNSAPKGA